MKKDFRLQFRRWLVVLAVLGVTVLSGHAAGSQDKQDMKHTKSPRIKLTPCRVDGFEGEARCGTYEVYEDREAARGRRIGLKMVVLPAMSATPAPDPLFFLAGGPGQAATESAEFFAEHFEAVRKDRDIVLVDQRGTGGSNPLPCRLWDKDPLGYFGDYFPASGVSDCRAENEKKADLRLYTTPIAMDDLDEVRAALGYERINLYGSSYGTFAAQVYLNRYPTRVRSIILKGVLPPGVVIPVPFAKDSQRSLDLLFDDCSADAECNRAFPNLREEFRSLLAQIDRGAIKVDAPHPVTGKLLRVPMSRGVLGTSLRTLLQSISSSSQIPMLIHRAATGDPAPLAKTVTDIRKALTKGVYFGMQFSIFSSEFVPLIDESKIEEESRDTFLGDHWVEQSIGVSKIWPRGSVAADYSKPVRSDVPILIISGFLDPATPPKYGDMVAGLYPNSQHVVVRYGGHSYSGLAPCMDNILADFIRKGSLEGLDTSCTNEVRRPPFVTRW